MGRKVVYHYLYRAGERERLAKEYRLLPNSELLYQWRQPDCPGCQESVKRTGALPVWCSECCTIRQIDSPLIEELRYRNLWRIV